MLTRCFDLVNKAWLYLLTGLEQPWYLPQIAWYVAFRHVHLGELLKLNRHRQWLQAADIRTVLDVGANTGQFASAARVLLPQAQIYSFEPLPECFEKLMHHLNPQGHFTAFCVAVGEKTGKIEFCRNVFAKSSSVLPLAETHKQAFPWAATVTKEIVQLESLDSLSSQLKLEAKVLLKIDVQGYELKVIQGARTMLKHIDYVLVETSFHTLYEGQAGFHELYQELVAEGFAYQGIFEQLLSPTDGSILQADALFIRRP